jgi:very-short-patch-repair endonuclease
MVDEALRKPTPHSGLERTFLWILDTAGYPEPIRQFPVDIGWERPVHIDFAYPDLLIGIETDGYEPHAGRGQWERDRRRDAELVLRGWMILRFAHDDVVRRQDYVLMTLAEALRVRAAG